jgi:hypothetical protein
MDLRAVRRCWARSLTLGATLALGCSGDDSGGSASESTSTSTSTSTSGESTTDATTDASATDGGTTAMDDGRADVVPGALACKMAMMFDPFPADQECFGYSYVGGALTITHGNGAFNCCVKTIEIASAVSDAAIELWPSEGPDFEPCLCTCAFDVDYVISGLAVGIYTITMHGLYVPENDPPLTATVDLAMTPIGQICAPRSGMPWG